MKSLQKHKKKKSEALNKEALLPIIAEKQNHNANGKTQTLLQHKAMIIMIKKK